MIFGSFMVAMLHFIAHKLWFINVLPFSGTFKALTSRIEKTIRFVAIIVFCLQDFWSYHNDCYIRDSWHDLAKVWENLLQDFSKVSKVAGPGILKSKTKLEKECHFVLKKASRTFSCPLCLYFCSVFPRKWNVLVWRAFFSVNFFRSK